MNADKIKQACATVFLAAYKGIIFLDPTNISLVLIFNLHLPSKISNILILAKQRCITIFNSPNWNLFFLVNNPQNNPYTSFEVLPSSSHIL